MGDASSAAPGADSYVAVEAAAAGRTAALRSDASDGVPCDAAAGAGADLRGDYSALGGIDAAATT